MSPRPRSGASESESGGASSSPLAAGSRSRGASQSPATRASAVVERVAPPAVVAGLALVAWRAAARAASVPAVILPGPGEVAGELAAHWPTLLDAAAVTAATAGLGILGGSLAGAALAAAMTVSDTAAAVVRPYVVALRVVPVVAVAPLLFRWFGDGLGARALLAASLAVFPVTIATYQGLRATPEEYLALARSVGASGVQRFLRVRFPAAAPHVFSGLKIAGATGVVGAVVAEFLTLKAGIGYRVFRASTRLQTARMVAALGVLAALGVAFYLLPALAERRADWG